MSKIVDWITKRFKQPSSKLGIAAVVVTVLGFFGVVIPAELTEVVAQGVAIVTAVWLYVVNERNKEENEKDKVTPVDQVKP